ncbi:MAG TPA: phosphoenolpyruvate-protein phosphotransferase PtsP, partial [Halieaceae bacterium]|nr:phosphoenolpyruvate-protein phosphotransferase PtsP [Halieaceae bacterium]
YQARALARRADFLSVGSNDLTQYLLAVDRNNARVAGLYHAYHPAVLQALCMVAEAGAAEGKPVSICGELAGDPLAAVLLMAMGYGVLSMNATALPRVKKSLRSLTHAEARELLAEVMLLEHAEAVQSRLQTFMAAHGLQQFIHAPLG